MMSRKDYIKLAAALALTRPIHGRFDESWYRWDMARAAIADVLVSDNPRFDRERFNAATEK